MSSNAAQGARLAAAMGFLRRVREDPELAASVEALDPEDGMAPVIALAETAGFRVSAEDLRRAHLIDWQLRRARYA